MVFGAVVFFAWGVTGAWAGAELGSWTGVVIGTYCALLCGYAVAAGAANLLFWSTNEPAESLRTLMLGLGCSAGAATGVWLGATGFTRALGLFGGFAVGGLLLGVGTALLTRTAPRDPVATAVATLVVGGGAWLGHALWASPWAVAGGMAVALIPSSLLASAIAPQYVRSSSLVVRSYWTP
jgi:hypothetical protein